MTGTKFEVGKTYIGTYLLDTDRLLYKVTKIDTVKERIQFRIMDCLGQWYKFTSPILTDREGNEIAYQKRDGYAHIYSNRVEED